MALKRQRTGEEGSDPTLMGPVQLGDQTLTGSALSGFAERVLPTNTHARELTSPGHHESIGKRLCAAVFAGQFCDTDIELDEDRTTVKFMGLLLEESDVGWI